MSLFGSSRTPAGEVSGTRSRGRSPAQNPGATRAVSPGAAAGKEQGKVQGEACGKSSGGAWEKATGEAWEKATGEAWGKAPAEAATPSGPELLKATLIDRVTGKFRESHPYLWMALANPYNLSLLGGAVAVAAILQGPLLAVAAVAAEALWLLFGPDAEVLKRRLWAPQLAKARAEEAARARAARVAALDAGVQARVSRLLERQDRIRQLASQNPQFTGDLLRGELAKTDRLVDAFVAMAATCAQYEQYLATIDPQALRRDRDTYADAVKAGAADDPQTQIARKNLAIVDKRLERMAEIRRYLSVARGELDLIENSFELIADQIMTIQSPTELSGQLDELLDGVEAIRETAAETERLVGPGDRTL